jgi:hypothetical protein
MNKYYLNSKSDEQLILEKGIYENNIFIYLRDKSFYIEENHIRCYKFSVRRAKNSLDIKDNDFLFKIFIKNIKSIKLEKKNANIFFLIITYPISGIKHLMIPQKIRLREINNYLVILNTDNPDIIMQKQNDKILLLLDKIDEFEKKFKELSTEDEFILPIK